MATALGSGDDFAANDFTAAMARRLGVGQAAAAPLNQGYQYSSASPAVQNSAPAFQSTPSQGQPAPDATAPTAPTPTVFHDIPPGASAGAPTQPSNAAAALAKLAAFNQAQTQGYQYSSASPAVQNSAPAFQSTPSQGQPAYQQQDAPPSSAQLGVSAQQAAAALAGAGAPYGGQAVASRPGGLPNFFNATERNPATPFGDISGGAISRAIQSAVPTPTDTSAPTATPTGSATPILDAYFASRAPAGPTSTGGTVAPQPTPTQPTIQSPSTPAIGGMVGAQPTPTGQTAPTPGAATGSVTPIVSMGSQTGTGTVPTASGGLPQQTSPMNPSAQPSALDTITQQAASDLAGLQSMIANAKSPDVLNVFLQQGQSIMTMLAQQEAQLRADALKNGTTIDPATQFALDTMQKQLTTQLQGVRDNLNRRGLLQSGIELASENQVRSGNLSAEGQLLATRLSKIQQNLTAGLQAINAQRFTAMKDFGLSGASAQATADSNTLNQRNAMTRQLVGSRLALRGQLSAANQGSLNRQNAASIAATNAAAANTRLSQSQAFTAQQNDLSRRASDARQSAALAAAAGNLGLKQAYDAQAADLQRQFAASQSALYRTPASTTPSPSPTSSKLSTNNFIVQLDGAPDKNAAMAAFNRAVQDGTFANAGADPVAVLAAINAKQWPGGGFHLPFGLGG